MKWLIAIGAIVGFGAIRIRISPSNIQNWHIDPNTISTSKSAGYLQLAEFEFPADKVLAALNSVALQNPRTMVLAGSAEEGMITYISRSWFWGFPDYTTVIVRETTGRGVLTIYGRSRFGQMDFNVNRERIKTWLQAIEALK